MGKADHRAGTNTNRHRRIHCLVVQGAVRYVGKPVSVPSLQSLPVLFLFTLTRPLAYVVSNSANLILRSKGASNQLFSLRSTI